MCNVQELWTDKLQGQGHKVIVCFLFIINHLLQRSWMQMIILFYAINHTEMKKMFYSLYFGTISNPPALVLVHCFVYWQLVSLWCFIPNRSGMIWVEISLEKVLMLFFFVYEILDTTAISLHQLVENARVYVVICLVILQLKSFF